MRVSLKRMDYVKLLCRQMVKRCDEYQTLKDTPGREPMAAAIREEIVRLYAEISMWRHG